MILHSVNVTALLQLIIMVSSFWSHNKEDRSRVMKGYNREHIGLIGY